MREPSNSWEITYAILSKKPHLKLDVTYNEVVRHLEYSRMREINAWISENFSYKWFINHV